MSVPAPPPIARLLEIMRQLRAPDGGCPWDRAQSFASIAPCTIEEAYEVADAIDSGDPARLRDELGDLLFQVVFHAELARELGWFDFAGVSEAIVAKLVRRHPHVFAEARGAGVQIDDAETQSRVWEHIKAQERAARAAHELGDPSRLADLPRALPALTRARKLGARAAGVNFDFADADAARARLEEELAELDELAPREVEAAREDPRVIEEFGDVLFSAVNWGRHLGLDAEQCLRAANAKFERRFRQMEALARDRRLDLAALTPGEWDALWEEVK